MKRRILAILALLIGAVSVSAESNRVMVVYHGQTQVNREAYQFLKRHLSQLVPQVSLTATQDLPSIKPGVYRAVVVFNSGVASGVDPALQSFINGYSGKSELLLVNLVAGSKDTTVQRLPASADNGVDAVSAASAWAEGAEKKTWIAVHQQWVQMVVDFIKKA